MSDPKKIPTLEERWAKEAEEGEGLHVIDENEESLFDNDDDLDLDDDDDEEDDA